ACIAPAAVSRPQSRRHSQYGETYYRDDRDRTIISRWQRLNPYCSEYKQRDERGYQIARDEHRSNQIRSREQNDRRQPDPEQDQHRLVPMRTPQPNPAGDREQPERRNRQAAISLFERANGSHGPGGLIQL